MEAQCNALDHVLYVTIGSANRSLSLSLPPRLSTLSLFFLLPRRLSTLMRLMSFHDHCVSLQSDVDICWNITSPIAENSLHSHSKCSKELRDF